LEPEQITDSIKSLLEKGFLEEVILNDGKKAYAMTGLGFLALHEIHLLHTATRH
jgi:predicted transcriptional regulator